MTNDNVNIQEDSAITFLETLDFLRNSWQSIAMVGLLGFLGGVSYIALAPKYYEAISQVRMAQIGTSSASSPFGVPIEEPLALISRMQVPSSIANDVSIQCEVGDAADAVTAIYKLVKLSPIKGVPGVVEVKVLSSTKELAKSCSIAIFENIKKSQMALTQVLLEEAKSKLATDDARIESARKLIASAHQLGAAMPAAYLTARDELNFYLADREKMVDLINSVQSRGTTFVSPIYVSDKPAHPNKGISILVGTLAGIFLGLLIALRGQFWQKIIFMSQGKQ